MVKFRIAAVLLPVLVTCTELPAAPVFTVPTLTVIPAGPVGPAGPVAPVGPCGGNVNSINCPLQTAMGWLMLAGAARVRRAYRRHEVMVLRLAGLVFLAFAAAALCNAAIGLGWV